MEITRDPLAAQLRSNFRMWSLVAFFGVHPSETSTALAINLLRVLSMWPSKLSKETISYTFSNWILMLSLIGFFLSITCDLKEASSDFIVFGDDICVLLGLYLIFLKIILYRFRKVEILAIKSEFEDLHNQNGNLLNDQCGTIRKLQRFHYLRESVLLFAYSFLGLLLFAAICFQPFLSEQDQMLPFRGKFPISLDDPINYIAVYLYQGFCTIFNLIIIICIDNIGCIFISQTSLNLKILCHRIRQLGQDGRQIPLVKLHILIKDHQKIIRLIDSINHTYYASFVAQMGASTFIICLTAFEAVLAKDDPMVALKFQMYMFASLMQLFYWCWLGNCVHFDSVEVSLAASECRWFNQSENFKRDLLFVIQRSQKPLRIRAAPFYGFEFQSFASILSTSYSYFTLLRTLND